ncbi:hypothetical protein GUJ93_ZPchr0004g39793 [Zizania palustris]|uniref:Calmodulin binding protein-like N-terminal domain-containing protein n=1 Tax=Zizania palustris TaxID=103762 RepID=A0A8J5VZ34_ZIZPA|nr:hypothetical protein GUJ93_ZPchr0004g39793 [Zizania palustris]
MPSVRAINRAVQSCVRAINRDQLYGKIGKLCADWKEFVNLTLQPCEPIATRADGSAASPSPLGFCRTLGDQNQPPRYKLRFTNGLSNEVFTKKGICAVNGEPLKISVDVNNLQETGSDRLLHAKIRVVLDGDFNTNDQERWTSEDFSKHIVRPRDKVGAVLKGELEPSLKNGEAYLQDATFVDNSKFMRSGKFRLWGNDY